MRYTENVAVEAYFVEAFAAEVPAFEVAVELYAWQVVLSVVTVLEVVAVIAFGSQIVNRLVAVLLVLGPVTKIEL